MGIGRYLVRGGKEKLSCKKRKIFGVLGKDLVRRGGKERGRKNKGGLITTEQEIETGADDQGQRPRPPALVSGLIARLVHGGIT